MIKLISYLKFDIILFVFIHNITILATNTDSVVPETENLYMEGRIVQKLECRPNDDVTYYKLKSESIKKASMPQRQVQQLDRIVQNFKPVSDHPHNVCLLLKSKGLIYCIFQQLIIKTCP